MNGPAGPRPVFDGDAWDQADWRGHEQRVRRLRAGFQGSQGQEPSYGEEPANADAAVLVEHAAPLLIMDEPTAALDARAEDALFSSVRKHAVGRCILIITHRLASARHADRIYVLHRGRLIEQGKHDDLMALGGRYAELYPLQAAQYAAMDGTIDGYGISPSASRVLNSSSPSSSTT